MTPLDPFSDREGQPDSFEPKNCAQIGLNKKNGLGMASLIGMLIWECNILRHHASIVRECTDAGLSYKSNAMAEYLAMMI